MVAYLTLMEITSLISAASLLGLFILVAGLLNRVIRMMDIAVDIVEDIRNEIAIDNNPVDERCDETAR